MAPEIWIGIIAGMVLVFAFLARSGRRRRAREMRQIQESDNANLRQIVAQMSIDRHVGNRRR
jgi:hypothetical protein